VKLSPCTDKVNALDPDFTDVGEMLETVRVTAEACFPERRTITASTVIANHGLHRKIRAATRYLDKGLAFGNQGTGAAKLDG